MTRQGRRERVVAAPLISLLPYKDSVARVGPLHLYMTASVHKPPHSPLLPDAERKIAAPGRAGLNPADVRLRNCHRVCDLH
jgi:hypothetical protein